MRKILLMIVLILISYSFTFSQINYERIILYNSVININKDGSMLVSEQIRVHSEGREIKRGIYRDFPTDYKDKYGNNIKIKFEIQEILRDGHKEPYHTENLSNGIRIYIGDPSYFLRPGEYSYTITYKTNRQLGYFENFDELYWNVTGNGWGFEIESCSAKVILPERLNKADIKCFGFTGAENSREEYYKSIINDKGEIIFSTTRRLYPKEGLTIVVEWPKGVVHEPTTQEKILYFLEDNSAGIIVLIGVLIIFIYYLFTWYAVGRDPAKGTIIPIYEPPSKLSPAAIRYIKKMSFDTKAFTAALVDLCVKRVLSLEENDKDYTIVKKNNNSQVFSKDEQALISKLKFEREGNEEKLELKQKNHLTIQSSIKSLRRSLQNAYEKNYFITNRKYFIIGIIISLVFTVIGSLQGNEDLLFAMIWNTGWSIGVAVLLYTVFKSWRTAFAGRLKGAALASAIFLTLFSIPFVAGQLVGFYFLSESGSYLIIAALILIILMNIIFHHLLKAPTKLGRKLMDDIDGFKLYLSVAEKERLNSIKEPEKTPELFETYLPYAIALDVENEWGEKFESVLKEASAEGSSYRPGWYSGQNWDSLGASTFASSIGSSLTSTVSSSSTAPGSSSGGSGGSSGGGGGGGGGGGW